MIGWGEDRTRDAYDAVADTYADHFTSTDAELPVDLAMVDHFVALLADPKRVLDAGCGAGRMMPYLATRGCVVKGVDLSSEMVRRARADHPEFPVEAASLAQLPFRESTFDGVLSWYSTIHSPDELVPQALGEIRRVLRLGGVALLGFQTGNEIRDVSDGYRRRGHEITLIRYSRTIGWMAGRLLEARMRPVVTMERASASGERDGQGFIIAEAM